MENCEDQVYTVKVSGSQMEVCIPLGYLRALQGDMRSLKNNKKKYIKSKVLLNKYFNSNVSEYS